MTSKLVPNKDYLYRVYLNFYVYVYVLACVEYVHHVHSVAHAVLSTKLESMEFTAKWELETEPGSTVKASGALTF